MCMPSSASAPYPTSQYAANYPHAPAVPGPSTGRYMPCSVPAPDPGTSIKQCYNCGALSTPLWRRDPATQRTLCNACGLYQQQRHEPRPQALIDAENDEGTASGVFTGDPNGPQCSHCHPRETSVWRRNKDGDQVCNACGVYQRLRGNERPLSLVKHKVKPRGKHPQL
ncbi:hypothetical protein DFH06DRAFT_1272402 [Mycena polygramma]|nr:hypothetical protein DFH06DRAFT_1272402 [Mycena polygramma]